MSPLQLAPGAADAEFFATVGHQFKGDIRVGQGLTQQDFFNLAGFGAVGFQKFTAGGRVVEQVGHVYHRALAERGGRDGTAFINLPCLRAVVGAAGERKARHGGNGRQGFPPETQRVNGE